MSKAKLQILCSPEYIIPLSSCALQTSDMSVTSNNLAVWVNGSQFILCRSTIWSRIWPASLPLVLETQPQLPSFALSWTLLPFSVQPCSQAHQVGTVTSEDVVVYSFLISLKLIVFWKNWELHARKGCSSGRLILKIIEEDIPLLVLMS